MEEKSVTVRPPGEGQKANARESDVPTNFLLGCSEQSLGNFELVSLAAFNDLRAELHATLDHMIEEMTKANLARWFRNNGRAKLLAALQSDCDAVAWAKEQIRRRGRSQAEMEADAIRLSSLEPGAAHLAASLRYQERNIAAGKCCVCPEPQDSNSVRYCTKHLQQVRERGRKKSKAKRGVDEVTNREAVSENMLSVKLTACEKNIVELSSSGNLAVKPAPKNSRRSSARK